MGPNIPPRGQIYSRWLPDAAVMNLLIENCDELRARGRTKEQIAVGDLPPETNIAGTCDGGSLTTIFFKSKF